MIVYKINNIERDKIDIKYYFYKCTSDVDMDIVNSIVWVLLKDNNVKSVYIHRECVEVKIGTLTSSWLLNRYYYDRMIILNDKLYLSDNKNDIFIIKRLKKINRIYERT